MSDQSTPRLPDSNELASLDHKLALVRDRVTAVVHRYQTGFYLHGTGGIGKSYTVLAQLKALNAPYLVFNSRLTAKGLFKVLKNYPDAVHVFEDMERLTQDRDAQGVLRSALWAQPEHPRRVTWTTATGGEEQFVFSGGLIILANRPLADLPELHALATRISVLHLEVSDAEVAAKMRELAAKGYGRDGKQLLEAGQCSVIAEYLIEECRKSGCQLDLRLLDKSYFDYLQWEADHSSCGWQDLVSSNVHEAANHFRSEVNTLSREERRTARRKTLRLILAQTADPEMQLKLYVEQTGASRADFFRRKGEVGSGEFEGE
jgi:hypothetical protein